MAQNESIIFKVMVAIGGTIQKCDGIEWQGKLWLVPHWLGDKSQGAHTPARIIRFDSLPHKDTRGSPLADYVLTDPLPKELFHFAPLKRPIPGYEFQEMPTLTKPEGSKGH